MKIGFLQFQPEHKKKEKNLQKIREMLKDVFADIIVLPELFNTGYVFETKEELLPLAEEVPGYTTNFLLDIAKEKDMCIVAGFPELSDGDKIYNSACAVLPDGKIHIYRKIHLFNKEKLIFEKGDKGFFVFEFKGVKIGLMICFDWIFPESARTLALKGAQIICHPTNLVLPYCQKALPIRALENRVFICMANRIGTEKGIKFTGKSLICAPDSSILISANETDECVKTVDIDPSLALNKKITELNHIFEDRRPEFYF